MFSPLAYRGTKKLMDRIAFISLKSKILRYRLFTGEVILHASARALHSTFTISSWNDEPLTSQLERTVALLTGISLIDDSCHTFFSNTNFSG